MLLTSLKPERKYSDNSGSDMHKLQRGGTNRACRRICAISAVASLASTDAKCHFSALLPHIRYAIRRE